MLYSFTLSYKNIKKRNGIITVAQAFEFLLRLKAATITRVGSAFLAAFSAKKSVCLSPPLLI